MPWKTQKDNLKDLYGDLNRYKENGNKKMYDKTYSEVKNRLKAKGKGSDDIYWGMQDVYKRQKYVRIHLRRSRIKFRIHLIVKSSEKD